MVVQAIFYNNPDEYPAIINGSRIMAQNGHTVDILCRDNGQIWGVNYPGEIRLHRLRTRGRNSWSEYLNFVMEALRQAHSQALVFIGHDMHGLLPARLLAWRYRRPLIYHCHDFADRPDALARGGRLVKAFEQRFARTVDIVIVPDQDRAKMIAQALHLKQSPLIVANAPLMRPKQESSALPQALTAQSRTFERILFRQGRIGVGHGIEATIRSIPQWQNRRWGFVIMGYGEPAYVRQLTSLAQSLGVGEQFAVLSPVGYDQVAEFTAGASVGHALYEPIHINNVHITTASNKIMEYLAAGLPVLMSNRPALRQFIESHQCGLSADENVPDSIAVAVNRLLGDEAYAGKLGMAARSAFEKVFCYEKQYAPVLTAIQQLGGNRDGRDISLSSDA